MDSCKELSTNLEKSNAVAKMQKQEDVARGNDTGSGGYGGGGGYDGRNVGQVWRSHEDGGAQPKRKRSEGWK